MRTRVHLRPFRMRTPPMTNAQPRGWLLVAECLGAGPLTASNGRIATAERRRIHPWTSTGPEPHDSGHAKARECRAPYGNLGRNCLRMAIQGHPVPSARQAPASSMRATMGRKGARDPCRRFDISNGKYNHPAQCRNNACVTLALCNHHTHFICELQESKKRESS